MKHGANYLPTANNDYAFTSVNTPVEINVLSNDTGFEDGFGGITLFSGPNFGSISINQNYTFTFTPSNWFVGTATFRYLVFDTDGDQSIATVTVTVSEKANSIPVAVDDRRGCSFNTKVNIDVLTNDTGIDDTPLTLNIATQSENGVVSIKPDNTIDFTPNTGFIGTTTFDYEVCDVDNECNTATVTIKVKEGHNYVPIAADDTLRIPMKGQKIVDVLSNDSGLEDGVAIVKIISSPILAHAEVNPDKTITVYASEWFTGQDSLIYMVEDVDGDYDIATLHITITDRIDHKPLAKSDHRGTSVNTPIAVKVLENDSGLEDGSITVSINFAPANGNATVNSDLSVTYNPNTDFIGLDTFCYKVCDIDNDSSTATVYIMVREVNHVPLAKPDNFVVYKNWPSIFDVVANDANLNDGLGYVEIHTQPKNGAMQVNADHTITYTPTTEFVGKDSAWYTVYDVDGDSDWAKISITVKDEENFIPQAIDDEAQTYANTEVIVDILANDQNLSNGIKQVEIILESSNSTAIIMADNKLQYRPNEDYTGIDIILYKVCDIDNECDSASVHITVEWDPSLDVFIPEAFSPNGDGKNDHFEILNVERFERLTLMVYNRWGNLVYKSNDYKGDWDGRSNTSMSLGSKLPSGTYYYILKIVDTGKQFKGSVYIKR